MTLAAEKYDQSMTLALYSEDVLGFALRKGVDKTRTGFLASNITCSYGPQRDTSVQSCDIREKTGMEVTSLDPSTRYFLVAENYGNNTYTYLSLVKNVYATGKFSACLLPGPLLN